MLGIIIYLQYNNWVRHFFNLKNWLHYVSNFWSYGHFVNIDWKKTVWPFHPDQNNELYLYYTYILSQHWIVSIESFFINVIGIDWIEIHLSFILFIITNSITSKHNNLLNKHIKYISMYSLYRYLLHTIDLYEYL